MPSWAEREAQIALLARHQLFFVGGAPRSGTTWLQQILDCHPDVSCKGEGLFWQQLAVPLEEMMARRGQALETKNKALFAHTGGYPLPDPDDVEFLTGSAILLSLCRQSANKGCAAIGEKTPENVFFFPYLKRLFPAAKLIAIARDPRDVLTSAWHFFHKPVAGEDVIAAKMAYINSALPSLNEGASRMIQLSRQYPADCLLITYEQLRANTARVIAQLFAFLGVADTAQLVADCVERTSFETMRRTSAGGSQQSGPFLRKGIVGDWSSTLTPEMNAVVLRQLGWTFQYFGWSL
jgi:hypothetical protein